MHRSRISIGPRLEIRQVESFFWIATLGSFSAAARHLLITQSAISARIAELEKELDDRLFDRAGRHLALTRRGEAFMTHARQLLDVAARMKGAGDAPGATRATVRLGVVNTIAHTWLPRLIAEIAKVHPDIDVHVHVGVSHTIEGKLYGHEVDVAMLAGQPTRPGLRSHSLGRQPLALIASTRIALPRRALSLAEIAEHRLITYERGTVVHRLISDLFRQAGIWPIRLTGSNSVGVMMEFALREIGLCAIPASVAAHHIAQGELRSVRVDAMLPSIEFSVACSNQPFNEAATAVADLAIRIGDEARMESGKARSRLSEPRRA